MSRLLGAVDSVLTNAPARPPRHSRRAVLALTFSVCWLFGIGSVLGLLLGWQDLRESRRSGGSVSALAVAAVVLGLLGLLAAVVSAAIAINLEPFESEDHEVPVQPQPLT